MSGFLEYGLEAPEPLRWRERIHTIKPSLHMPFLPLVNSVFLTFPLENTERTVHGGARPDILGTSNLPR